MWSRHELACLNLMHGVLTLYMSITAAGGKLVALTLCLPIIIIQLHAKPPVGCNSYRGPSPTPFDPRIRSKRTKLRDGFWLSRPKQVMTCFTNFELQSTNLGFNKTSFCLFFAIISNFPIAYNLTVFLPQNKLSKTHKNISKPILQRFSKSCADIGWYHIGLNQINRKNKHKHVEKVETNVILMIARSSKWNRHPESINN